MIIDQIKRTIQLGSIYSIGSISQGALFVLLFPIYTSFLSPHDFGIIGLMSITVSLLTRFVSAPINSAFTRFYYAPEYKEKSGILLFNLFLWALLIITFCTVIFWRISEYLAGVLLQDRSLAHLLKVYALILFLQPLSSLFLCLLRMLERAKYFVFTSISSLLISAGLTLYLLIVLKKGVLSLIVGNLLSLIVTVIMVLPVFIKRSTFKLSRSILIPPLKYAYPLLLSEYSNLLIQSGDRYVLRIFNSVSMVGLYSFGYQIAGILQTALVTPLKQALQPVVLKQEADPAAIRGFLRVGATYFYLIGCAACLLISLFSREILMLFARKEVFWAAWVIVPIITYSYVQHGLGNFVGWGMGLMKKSFHVSGIVLVAALVNIGLNFLLVPQWGMLGAAFATMLSYIVWNVLKAYYSAKFYDLRFEVGRLLHITVIGFGLYGLSLLVDNNGAIGTDVALKLLFFLGYPLILWATGFFSESEKEYLLKPVNRFKKAY
ncbi:oligosaccharide flippase family protein [Candidatus Poribacteria bacterium]|nr:oligosaccharide flippase family protein [Candidatus Poribacteria bacterium]